jgi:uncharacterized protein
MITIVDTEEKGLSYYVKYVTSLVVGQSVLILIGVIAATVLHTPNWGLGPAIDFSQTYLGQGVLWTLPLGVVAFFLDRVEDRIPALQEVTRATQQITLAVLGPTFRPVFGLMASLGLGLAAGVGEELLFRGVMQYELGSRFVNDVVAVGMTSVIFGALHAVTPLYAFLAGVASIYFGWLYLFTGNLAVPMSCHAFYDLVAFMYGHWTVTQMSPEEQAALQKRGR